MRYERYEYAESAVCVGHQVPGAPSQLLKKTTMPMKRHSEQSGAEKKTMKTKPARHFQVGYIHKQISIKKIYRPTFIFLWL